MKRSTITMSIGGTLLAAVALAGCASGTSSSSSAAAAAGGGASQPAAAASQASANAGVVLPVNANPIVNDATAPDLQITYAAVEDNVDPATGKAIDDCLELTLKNTGTTTMDGIEVYYEMTDIVTGQKEGYYQKLDGVSIPAGQETTVFFDDQNLPGHFPDNQFSVYRTSTNEVDFAIQASAPGAQIATAIAVKATNTGEKAD